MTERPSSRAAGNLTVQLGPELKIRWAAWCAIRGQVPGPALRNMLERALASDNEPALPAVVPGVRVSVGKCPDTDAKLGREIYFTRSEHNAVEATAAAQGFGFHEWVIGAVRAALTNSAAYGQSEIEALTQSNLRVTQLVAELAAARRAAQHEELHGRLSDLERVLREHVEAASVAMARGAQRWQLKL